MDATDNTPTGGNVPAPTAMGGTVEPTNRVAIAKERFQAPNDPAPERYELRDPFAEVTYRTSDFAAMVAKADKLGSDRFVAVDAEGQRTTVVRNGGQWQRPGAPPPPSQAVRDPPHEREAGWAAGHGRSAEDPTPDRSPQPERAAAESLARIDATAERAAKAQRLQAALAERYVVKRGSITVGDVTIGRTEYRFRGDTSRVAFTESTFRLATDTNSPSVARSMVDVAEARNWRGLRVAGNPDFRRMVWLEASVRGVKTIGYEPSVEDIEVLKREREARLVNRIEPVREEAAKQEGRGSVRGSGGRKAVLSAIDAVLVAKGVPAKRREAILLAAEDKLAQRARDGNVPKVKVYDKAAPSQRHAVTPPPEMQRTRDRPGPTR